MTITSGQWVQWGDPAHPSVGRVITLTRGAATAFVSLRHDHKVHHAECVILPVSMLQPYQEQPPCIVTAHKP